MWNGGLPGGGGFDDDGFGGAGLGGMGANAAAPMGTFTRQFRAYPVSFIDREHMERGDKIMLPPSALDFLARHNISYPMLFQLESRGGLRTHCGVLEFVATEGHANLPYWLMQNLKVDEGDMITIRNATLPKGTYVKFQPQSSDFLDIYNPKAVLEATLRGFTCLTKGDAIAISYNDKTYHIDVLEVAPGDAISIIEADVNVEFAPPPDYVEPVPQAAAGPARAARPARDPSERLRKRLDRLKKPRGAASAADSGDDSAGDDADDAPDRQIGRDSDDSDEDGGPPPPPKFPGAGHAIKASRAGSSSLTFGGGSASGTAHGDAEDEDKAKEKAKEKAKFVAFAGSGRSLR